MLGVMGEQQFARKRADVTPDLADRMAKSLQLSGLRVQQMADLLECSRTSVGGWLNRRHPPSAATLMMWAQFTDVPYEWLSSGKWPKNPERLSAQVRMDHAFING